MNKYVEFVSDEDFLECIRHVVDFYLSDEYKEEPLTHYWKEQHSF